MRIVVLGGSSSGGWLGATLARILHDGLGRVVELMDLIPSVEMYPLPWDIHDPLSCEIWQGGVWRAARPVRPMLILARDGEHVLKGVRKLMSISE
jgi:hypothetical protein